MGNKMGGAAMCSSECQIEGCTNINQSGSTNVPAYCRECSNKYGICRRCGCSFYEKDVLKKVKSSK